jgi:hypothetical protein
MDILKKAAGVLQGMKQTVKKINRGGLPGGRQTGPNAFKHLKRGTGSPAGPKLQRPKPQMPKKRNGPR